MLFKVHRTISIGFKPGAFREAVPSMGLAARNLRNTGVFLVKNVLSSFDLEGKLRLLGNLHANPIQALAAADGPAQACDAKRAPKNDAKAASKNPFRLPPTALPDLAGRGLGPTWLGLHADANGAANIQRKALPSFRAHAGILPRFELGWLSPRGLRPFQARLKAAVRI